MGFPALQILDFPCGCWKCLGRGRGPLGDVSTACCRPPPQHPSPMALQWPLTASGSGSTSFPCSRTHQVVCVCGKRRTRRQMTMGAVMTPRARVCVATMARCAVGEVSVSPSTQVLLLGAGAWALCAQASCTWATCGCTPSATAWRASIACRETTWCTRSGGTRSASPLKTLQWSVACLQVGGRRGCRRRGRHCWTGELWRLPFALFVSGCVYDWRLGVPPSPRPAFLRALPRRRQRPGQRKTLRP
jgi:hypothetical protein